MRIHWGSQALLPGLMCSDLLLLLLPLLLLLLNLLLLLPDLLEPERPDHPAWCCC